MPLINSIFKGIYRQQLSDAIVLAEIGSENLYEYAIKRPIDFTEGEVLEIRVDQFHKNFELNRHDKIEGPVLQASFDPSLLLIKPFQFKLESHWDPDWVYGKEASTHFFPFHTGRKFPLMNLMPDEEMEIPENERSLFTEMVGNFRNSNIQTARQQASEILSRGNKRIDCYYVLSVLETAENNFQLAGKYLRNAITLIEWNQPEDRKDWILNGGTYPNGIYLQLLIQSGLHAMANGNDSSALEMLRKAYQLDPWDHGGARYHIHRLTKESFPEMDGGDKHIRPINPYLYSNRFTIPLHDTYDPDTKPDRQKWLAWEPEYRMLLIQAYHSAHPDNTFNQKTIGEHLTIHQIAETALADSSQPRLRQVLAQYLASGYSRHAAIHSLGSMLLTQVVDNLRRAEQKDQDADEHTHQGHAHDHHHHADHHE